MDNLNNIEKDFIEFIAKKRGETKEKVDKYYRQLKKSFDFKSPKFRQLTEDVEVLYKIYFGFDKEDEILRTYTLSSYLSILRFLSYSSPAKVKHLLQNFIYFLKMFFSKNNKRAVCHLKRNIKKLIISKNKINLLNFIRKNYDSPIILDYGCGLAYLSFKLSKQLQNTKVILVDIDSIMLDFVEYRFSKNKINFEIIRVKENNLYPELPTHNVCIADEIMEHLRNPIKVYKNINKSLADNGILYGDYDDHCPELFHLHTNLSFLRNELIKDFKKIGPKSYIKKIINNKHSCIK